MASVGGGPVPQAVFAAEQLAGASEPVAIAEQPLVDFWVEASFARINAAGSGNFRIVHAGADYLVTSDLLIGLGAQIDRADMTMPGNGIVQGTGYMVGPYLSARLIDELYFDARLAGGQAFNTISPLGTYSDDFRSIRFVASAALIGSFDIDAFSIRPELRLSWFSEQTDAYTDSLGNAIPSINVETGTLKFGPMIGYTIDLGGGTRLTPYVKPEGVWTFAQHNTAANFSNAPGLNTTGLRARLEGGFTYATDAAFSLSGSTFYDGIGQSGYEAYGGSVRLSAGF